MATVTAGYTWTSGETVTPAKMNDAALPTVVVADDEVTNDKLSLTANAGEIKKALNADNAPPIYACRAWVNFDGTKDTTGAASTANTNRLILASGNVTNVSRNAAGNYTVAFSTAMPDANYAVNATARATTSNLFSASLTSAPTTSDVNVICVNASGATTDSATVSVTIFR